MRGKYQFRFDPWALGLCLLIMAPNFIWFIFPAPKDILRGQSVTGTMDAVASVFQAAALGCMCLLKNKLAGRLRLNLRLGLSIGFTVLYWGTWGLYYLGETCPAVILSLCLCPCLALGLYMWDRKNIPALACLGVFSLCHLLYGVLNYIV